MHYYPDHITAADVLQQAGLLPAELARLRQKINTSAGPSGRHSLKTLSRGEVSSNSRRSARDRSPASFPQVRWTADP
ncbi:hypothetical protein [Kutzneria buriramensis]|uniref:hypothetical protein n=1 Tax=Kutzneria buriramensis TaxID=1045776 RepID=UPI0011C19457|nr:hypothetical protein [Kutzneria buriramensis]